MINKIFVIKYLVLPKNCELDLMIYQIILNYFFLNSKVFFKSAYKSDVKINKFKIMMSMMDHDVQ